MVKRHESLKKYIKTILDQLPQYIEAYPPEEQELLKNFLSIVAYYEEADFQRKKLSQRFEEYNERVIKTNQYLNTAFLWFTESYLSTANLLLNISKFHATSFYEYLTKYLRGNPDNPGLFQLVRNKCPLPDLAWEKLQYSSNKLLYPLSNDQFEILIAMYSSITKTGVHALDSRKLKTFILEQVEFPKKVKPSIELNRFFKLIDGRWFLHFYSPAFGLDLLYIQFQLQSPSSLEDIIDFQNKKNTVLTQSYIYRARNSSKTYIGRLLVPTLQVNQLENYFHHYEKEGYLTLKEFSRIRTTRVSTSLTHYKVDFGWTEPSVTKIRQLTALLKSKHPTNKQNEDSTLSLTSSFNRNWIYNQHPLPAKIIELYCKIPDEYSYSDLPLNTGNQHRTALSRDEIGLLKQFSSNEVVSIGFVPWRLVYEYSLDLYWINLPTIPDLLLKRFLCLVPYSDIYYTENLISLLTRLTPKVAHWIKTDLNWRVIPVTLVHYPQNLDFNWFDVEKLKGKTPLLLLK